MPNNRSALGSMQSLSAESTADCKSVTPSMKPLTNDKQYYHMPFNERKPSQADKYSTSK